MLSLKNLAVMLVLALGAPAAAGQSVVTLPGDRAFPESVTSTRDGTLYAGSLASGGVFRARPGAEAAEIFIAPGAFGTRSVMGVLADERSGTLWLCSNDISGGGVPGPGSEPGSWLKGFDLKTGRGKVSARFPGDHNFCNDMAVARDGSVYVTNSAAPQILRLKPRATELEIWLSDPRFQPEHGAGLDGIAFGGNGDLYVDTFTPGELYRVAVKDGAPGAVTKLATPRPLVLTDALRPIGPATFLLVEGAGRLDRITIQGDEAAVETLRDGLLGPTGVTPVGKTAWVSEGQLSFLFDPAKKGQSPVLPFRLSAVPMP